MSLLHNYVTSFISNKIHFIENSTTMILLIHICLKFKQCNNNWNFMYKITPNEYIV